MARYSRWLARQKGKKGKLSAKTRATNISAIKTWIRWMVRQGHLLTDPTKELELPRFKPGLPKDVFTPSEVEKILDCIDLREPLGLRDRVIIEVLWSTLMRRSELANLKLYDLDPGRGLVMIRQGKQGADRLVPIGDRALRWLNRYLIEVRPFHLKREHGAVFVSVFGEPLGSSTITERVTACIASAKLGKTGGPHTLRHAGATAMLSAGADVRHVQELLGHARLATTTVYTRVAIKDLKATHQRSHPTARQTPSDEPEEP